jgi:hypothetical protein
MKSKVLAILFLFNVMLLLTGCANSSNKEGLSSKNSGLLEPSAQLKFSDVPVPAGFRLLPQDSYTFESAGVRVGVLKYKGKASPDRVVNFYREQMPMYNWNLLNLVEYGDSILNFERENESCIVNLSPRGSSCIITASVGPKAQAPPKKPKQPIK